MKTTGGQRPRVRADAPKTTTMKTTSITTAGLRGDPVMTTAGADDAPKALS
jgi:hypothetical protein